MDRFNRLCILPVIMLMLAACESSDDEDDMAPEPEPPAPQRGELIGEAPELRASYSPDELLSLASSNEVAQLLVEAILAPECTIDVYQLQYQTVDPAGNITPASGALMVPNDADAVCQGARPIVLYGHGTSTDKAFNIADLEAPDNAEGLLMTWAAETRRCSRSTARGSSRPSA